MTLAILHDPNTGAAWQGPLPSHARWDSTSQTFAFARPEGTPIGPQGVRTTAADWLDGTLNAAPKARQPYKNGHITRPPMRLSCPQCAGPNICVPITGTVDEDGRVHAWFGKGTCHCPDCGHTGTGAKMRSYTMYEHAALVALRARLRPALVAAMRDGVPPVLSQ